MKLAVLMSTYNGERFLQTQIESILNQRCDCQVELWVRDDGSTDSTCSILQTYADRGVLHWYTGENLKPAKSFLDLIHHCPGYDYYAFADQDDVWYPDKLQNGINRICDLQIPAVSFANAHLVDGDLNSLGRNVHRNPPHVDFYSVTCGGGIMGCTMVFNSQLASLIQGVPMPGNLIMHDYYVAIVCTLHDGVILYDHEPCMDYRQHGSNVVGSSSKKWDALKNRIQLITQKKTDTLDKMAASICCNYKQVPDHQKLRWLSGVSQYRKSVVRSLRLAMDNKAKYNSANMCITLRLALVLRNH